jgi:sucrose synthase
MSELLQAVLASDEKNDLRSLMSELRLCKKRYLLRNDILNLYEDFCTKHQKNAHQQSSHLSKLIYYTQEIIQEDSNLCLLFVLK